MRQSNTDRRPRDNAFLLRRAPRFRVRNLALGLALGLALLSSACASGPPMGPERLPFHVALVPLETVHGRGPSAGLEGSETSMLLTADPAALSQLIRQSLESDAGFERATLLEPGGPFASATTDQERERMWIERAEAVEADLILVCDLRLEPKVNQSTNSRFWLTFPLFALGGPFAWFVRDRTYFVDALLEAGFYSPEKLDPDRDWLFDRFSRVANVDAHFGELDRNFISRAHGRVGRYALSVIVPAGFLAKQSDGLADSLSQATLDALCRVLAEGVQGKRTDLMRGDAYPAPFYLEAQDLNLESTAEGSLVLRGFIHLEPDEDVPEIRSLKLEFRSADGLAMDAPGVRVDAFTEDRMTAGERGRRFAFETRFDPPHGARLLHLEIEAGERNSKFRTYTLVLPQQIDFELDSSSPTARARRPAEPQGSSTAGGSR